MEVVPFKAQHFWDMKPQPSQAYLRDYIKPEHIAPLEGGNAWSGLAKGSIVWCFGWFDIYPTRAVVWTYVSEDAGPHFVAIHRECERILSSMPHRRIETEVDCEFREGHRWMQLLGFKMECERMRGNRIDGGDSALYARVK